MDSIATVFPHDDVVARFVVAMSMTRNDIEHASLAAGAANKNDDPAFTYLVGVAMGHIFEAVRALQRWRHEPEVKAFLGRLPPEAKKALATAAGLVQRVGGGAAEHARDRTFHYPYPSSRYTPSSDDELADVLKTMSSQAANVTVLGDERKRFRLEFADEVALALALAKLDVADHTRLREQMDQVRDGGVALAHVVDRLLVLYADERQIFLG
jgi:hypothetical protein